MFQGRLENPDLKWETNITANLGLDMGFFDQRLQLTVDIYNVETKGLLLDAPIPQLSGFKNMMINAGKTNNKGVEVSITSTLPGLPTSTLHTTKTR